MAYLVEFSAHAAHDLEILYVEKHVVESQLAARWYNGLEEAVHALRKFPHRCPPAPEARQLKRSLRHLLYGKKPHVYRVIHEVDDGRRSVWVFTIRHGAMRKLKPSDLM
jgi:toxin ParE1/3/4